jgi:BON domain
MSRYKSAFAAAVLAALTVVSCNKQAAPNDDAITTDIKAKMFSEPLLKAASVTVDSKNGIVTLTGQVPDDAARLAAERIASQTNGVKQVIDSTAMAPAGPSADMNQVPPPPVSTPSRSSSKNKRNDSMNDQSNNHANGNTNSGGTTTAADLTPPTPPPPAQVTPPPPATPPPPPPPKPITVTIPASTVVTIRTIDTTTSRTGQIFNASIDTPVVADDRVVVPKGANATLKLVNASSAGKYKGTSELTVSLDSFTYQGKTYMVSTSDVQEKGGSRGKRSAAVIGGGAVLGALIGGLAGGGKGAAIGAAAGGGGGAAVQGLTKGQQIKIPAETRLDFTLHDPVDVTFLPTKRAHSSSGTSANSSSSSSSDQAPSPSSDRPPQE